MIQSLTRLKRYGNISYQREVCMSEEFNRTLEILSRVNPTLEDLIRLGLTIDQNKRKDRVRSGKWNPSSFSRCFRNQFWNRKNEPVTNPPDIKSLKRMYQGKHTHLMYQSLLPKEIVEVKVETDNTKGYADLVLKDKVKDYKCVDEYQYNRYCKIPTPKYLEKEVDKIRQVCWYCIELNKPVGVLRPTIFGTFTGIDHEFKVSNYKHLVEKELSILNGVWEKDILPPPIPRTNWDCDYCSWKDKCKRNDTLSELDSGESFAEHYNMMKSE